jgi:ABC-type bacteriocin/lantibiotic exporter with double-glycine peptidase domain
MDILKLAKFEISAGSFKVQGDQFCVRSNEFIQVFGQSGSGKSLFLKSLANKKTLQEGNIQYIPQTIPSLNKKVEELLLSLNIEIKMPKGISLDSDINSLSSGQRQAINLEIGFHTDAQLLIWDESFTNLDASWREEFFLKLNSWVTAPNLNRAVILVTHEALKFDFNRKYLFENGTCLEC